MHGRTDARTHKKRKYFYPKNIKVARLTPKWNLPIKLRKQKSLEFFFELTTHKILPPCNTFGIKTVIRCISKGIFFHMVILLAKNTNLLKKKIGLRPIFFFRRRIIIIIIIILRRQNFEEVRVDYFFKKKFPNFFVFLTLLANFIKGYFWALLYWRVIKVSVHLI